MIFFTARRLAVSGVAAAAMLCATPASGVAQGLADVARASTAGRKEQPKPAKVYTNDNLRPDITPSAPAPSPAAGDTSPSTAEPAAAPAAAQQVPAASADAAALTPVGDARGQTSTDEAAWRARITGAREALERSTSFASALQSQINALTIDFVNIDDPAQRAQVEQRRTKAVAELERTQREIEAGRKAITAIEDEARKAGVPAGWLR